MIDDDHPLARRLHRAGVAAGAARLLRNAIHIGVGYDTNQRSNTGVGSNDRAAACRSDIEPAIVGAGREVDRVTAIPRPLLDSAHASPNQPCVGRLRPLAANRRAFAAAMRPARNGIHRPMGDRTQCARRCRRHGILSSMSAPTPIRSREVERRARMQQKTFHVQRRVVRWASACGRDRSLKLARPDLPVVCLIGDGCFQMTHGWGRGSQSASGLATAGFSSDDVARADQGQADPRQFPLLRTTTGGRSTLERRAYSACPAAARALREQLSDSGGPALAADGRTVIEAS